MSDLTKPPHVPSCVSTGEGVTVPTATATPRTTAIKRKIIADLRAFLHEKTDRIDLSASVDSTCELVATLERELSSAQAALAEAKAEVERLKEETVWGFYEEEVPQYGQGSKFAHEICSPITAEEANGMVKSITQLRTRVVELEAHIVNLLPYAHMLLRNKQPLAAYADTLPYIIADAQAAIDAAKGTNVQPRSKSA